MRPSSHTAFEAPDWARRRPLDRRGAPRPVPGGRGARLTRFLPAAPYAEKGATASSRATGSARHVPPRCRCHLWFLKRDLDAGRAARRRRPRRQRAVAERRARRRRRWRAPRPRRPRTRVWHTTATVPEMPSSTCGLPNLKRHEGARTSCPSTRTGAQRPSRRGHFARHRRPAWLAAPVVLATSRNERSCATGKSSDAPAAGPCVSCRLSAATRMDPTFSSSAPLTRLRQEERHEVGSAAWPSCERPRAAGPRSNPRRRSTPRADRDRAPPARRRCASRPEGRHTGYTRDRRDAGSS